MTISDEAVEVAARAMWDYIGGDLVAPTAPAYLRDARFALEAAAPILLAEKDAEISNLSGMLERTEAQIHDDDGFISQTVDQEQEIGSLTTERDAALARLAAVEALASEWSTGCGAFGIQLICANLLCAALEGGS